MPRGSSRAWGRYRRREHGLPGAEDREARRGLQPHAGSAARRRGHRGDGAGGEDSGHGEDAGRLERRRGQCARCSPGSSRTPVPPRSPCTGAPPRSPTRGRSDWTLDRAGRRSDVDPGARQRRLRRARTGRRSPRVAPASAACSSGAACFATRGFSRRPATWRPGAPRARLDARTAGSSCSTTSICCCTSASNEAEGFRHSAPQCVDAEEMARSASGPYQRSELRAPARGRERWVVNKLRAQRLVLEGLRRRLAVPHVDQPRRVDRRRARVDSGILLAVARARPRSLCVGTLYG